MCIRDSLGGVPDVRQPDVAVGVGVAVPREMLGRRGHPGALVPLHLRGDQPRHRLRPGTEGAYADHGIRGIDVHVGDRRVVLPDAHRVQFLARDPAGRTGVLARSPGAQCHRAGEERGGRADPCHYAVFLVGGDQQGDGDALGGGGPLDAVGEVGDLVGLAGVVRPAEVDDAAEMVLGDQFGGVGDAHLLAVGLGVGGVRIGRGVPVDPHHEELADLFLQLHPGNEPSRAGTGIGGPCGTRAGSDGVNGAAARTHGTGGGRGGGQDGTSGVHRRSFRKASSPSAARRSEENFQEVTSNRKRNAGQCSRALPVGGCGGA